MEDSHRCSGSYKDYKHPSMGICFHRKNGLVLFGRAVLDLKRVGCKHFEGRNKEGRNHSHCTDQLSAHQSHHQRYSDQTHHLSSSPLIQKPVFPEETQHLQYPDQPLSYGDCGDHGVHGQVEELVAAAPLQVVMEEGQDQHQGSSHNQEGGQSSFGSLSEMLSGVESKK